MYTILIPYMHALLSSGAPVLNGLFENLHTVRFLDINFKKTSKMADRLAEADSMLKYVYLAEWMGGNK